MCTASRVSARIGRMYAMHMHMHKSCNVVITPGTTGLAALRLGRHFTGIELSETFTVLAAERLAQARRKHQGSDEP